jgi:serine/threonine protein kinase
LHEKKIVHRDLNPDNIYFSSKKDDDLEILVDGFNFAQSITNTNVTSNEKHYLFHAPEVLDNKNGDTKVDIWALGCIAYLLIDTLPPFGSSYSEK